MSNEKVKEVQKLKSIILSNNAQIDNLNHSITKMERAHDSLVQFRRNVVSTQEGFKDIIHNQKQYLSPVKSIGKENKSAKNYGNGMSNTLSGFGTKVVGLAMIGLLAKIDIKLGLYKSSINKANDTINRLQTQSANHNSSIIRLEKQMKEQGKSK